MAFVASGVASSSSSSLAVMAPDLKIHDVFVSFRGEDTRDNFTSHLRDHLLRTGIETYIDYRIPKGDDVWTELVRAMEDSALFLVIFSENYASSTWCLNELLQIMELKKTGEADVIPVFYKIDPSRVRKQTGSYQEAFAEYDKDPKQSEENIQQWKDALYEAANLSGFHSRQYRTESDLIQDIVKAILQKLNHKNTHELRGHFIYDENYTYVESLLKIESKKVQIIGIWGMGGIGKTTLAAAIFQKFSSQFEGTCFLENVAEESKRYGLNYICNKLISSLLGEELHNGTTKVIHSHVTRRLRHKKVFIVLDDVNTSKLLENLVGVGRKWLGAGSQVIVTTRDRQVLISRGVEEIHEVKKMNLQNSLQLFSLNSFGQNSPTQGYLEISEKVVAYAQGVPLALKVLGSFLRSKSEKEWDSALDKLKKIPDAEILKVLRSSYDELDDKDQNIFLDIACFFRGRKMDEVIAILNACGFFPNIGIKNLLDKALITIELKECIEMHDLIQEMGWEIVREESKKFPRRRSRLWDPEDVYDVLTNNKGTEVIEGILLDMTQIPNISLSSKVFKSMPNLRILVFRYLNPDSKRINSVYLPKGLDLLPNNLRCFVWDGCPLKSLSSNFCPEKLVELSLTNNNMEKLWHGVQNLPNLEKIDLSYSSRLKESPNLSHAPNLKHVRLRDCTSLVHVDPSILSPSKLEFLEVTGCTSLKSLCGRICSPSLQYLYANSCFNLQEFSVLTSDITPSPRFNLGLEGTSLDDEMPPSILQMRNLVTFAFPICQGLKDLPENLTVAVVLYDSRRAQQQEETLINLTKAFSSSAGFHSLRWLILYHCRRLYELPSNISMLSSLEYLDIFDCNIISFPESIKYIPRLKHVAVENCRLLRSITELPLSIQILLAWDCDSLDEIVLSSSNKLSSRIQRIVLLNCIKLDQHSYDAILKDAIVSMDQADNSIFCLLPGDRRDQVGKWFHYHSTHASFTVELPPNLLGVVFYILLSPQGHGTIYFDKEHRSSKPYIARSTEPDYSIGCERYVKFSTGEGLNITSFCTDVGCECYLETNTGERINIKSFSRHATYWNVSDLETMSDDHVFIWYDAEFSKMIMEAIKEMGKPIHDSGGSSHKAKFTIQIHFPESAESGEIVIKECGLRWIYPLEDQIMEEKEGGYDESKTSSNIHDFEATAAAVKSRVEGSYAHDEQEQMFHPTKRRIFGTPSNIQAQEVQDLRGRNKQSRAFIPLNKRFVPHTLLGWLLLLIVFLLLLPLLWRPVFGTSSNIQAEEPQDLRLILFKVSLEVSE